jgi:hypothetical protein
MLISAEISVENQSQPTKFKNSSQPEANINIWADIQTELSL